jgi:hypothetical protein
MTLVGITLTAWLLPAITRQWNDRQKAHELQASLVAEMASATARALIGGEDALAAHPKLRPTRELVGKGHIPPGEREWAVESLLIKAKLHAYFPPAVGDSWGAYKTLVSFSLFPIYGRGTQLSTSFEEKNFNQFFFNERKVFKTAYSLYTRTLTGLRRREVYATLEEQLLKIEEQLASDVLASHPKGYSTTASDLFHDLIP